MSHSITADVFAALKILVLERLNVGSFRVTGTVPNWLGSFCRRPVISGMQILIPEEEFLFLENFLIDAEEFWQSNNEDKLKSGLWTQIDLTGQEYHFEASAICINHQKILLIESLDGEYKEMQSIIQKARENELTYQQFLKENQKKEVLIHCIIHDIAGQLSGINCCLALLEFENLTPKGKERLEIGRKQSVKQEMLIRQILDAFLAEVQSLEAFSVDVDKAPDALISTQELIEILTPTFTLNKMRLLLAPNVDLTADWKVVGDKSRLDRVISNLTENALRHSPGGSVVTIDLQQDGEYVLVIVNDQGSGVAPEMAQNLFQKFSQGKDRSGRVGLGLYFCRITVERWGGEIGYSPRPEGGSRFWLRLPKVGRVRRME
ncbi:HAMP domain-containing histidine kinase [Plectonema radiosum NIES-515]|uniref:histidine kinase n=1 Tax=Plectonema radiosum NIES-515 TaxID=2986073 RepID=A0ABT3AXG3_9CYAN|nr:HAMP domain-containing sensor histidine kinase [Plectonema radiosum]MCV3213817.1 HAMP domain-containing histidine kinase [Plectonema radiosum NIES-515]